MLITLQQLIQQIKKSEHCLPPSVPLTRPELHLIVGAIFQRSKTMNMGHYQTQTRTM
jgi:hypothetical protein